MDKPESSCAILSKLNLYDVEKVVKETYHEDGPGRPPRKPMGIFKALMVKRLQQIPSERELCRRLWKDDNLRELCDIEAEQNPYHPSQLSRFKKRVGARRLQRIMNKLLKELLRGGVINGETVVLDATFIKAYSRRDPHENSRGKSDPEARVGRNGRTYELGYKLHVAADAKSELPLAVIAASANENEKKHSLNLLEKTKTILKRSAATLRSVIADSQYSDSKLRNAVGEAVIPYPANQKRGVKGILRVDKKFRTYGPEDQKREYHKRPHIEAVYSFLKTQYSLAVNKVRGLRNVTSYALYSLLCLVLNREAAENLGRPDKAVSPTFFNT